MKKRLWLCSAMLIGAMSTVTAHAGEWKVEAGRNGTQWRYEDSDGTNRSNGWYWLDGNGDGTAECYYFDADGWMLSNTLTPDGFTVNADGAWTESGSVMTRSSQQSDAHQVNADENTIPVTISVQGKQFEAVLLNNESTQALISRLPMTVTMGELNGNEKYYYLPSSLPTNTQSIGRIHAGDLMLYGSDCLVLFYQDFSTTYRYTRLGAVSNVEGLSEALGKGSVQVTFQCLR